MSFHPYPTYRTLDSTGARRVPAHWHVTPLKYEQRLITAKAEARLNPIALENVESWTGRLIPSEGDTSFDGEGIAFRQGDLLFGKLRPYLAKAAVAPSTGEAVGDFFVMRPTPSLNPRFALYRMLERGFIDAATASTYGSKMPRVSWDFLGRYVVATPPPGEQAAVVAFLDRETTAIDALVAEQRRLMELLQEKRQTVISHAVTKGLNPDARFKASGIEWLPWVPEAWETPRIGQLFREAAEPGDASLPILSVSIHSGVSDEEVSEDESERKITRSDDRSKYKRVAPGDLVYNMMRAWQGAFGTVAVDGAVSPAYVVARPRAALETRFVERLLRTPQAVEEMRRRSRGITDFRLRLYWDEFKTIRVPLPPVSETADILEKVKGLETEFASVADACSSCIELLLERRAALISAAVTGQIDVRHLAPAEAA